MKETVLLYGFKDQERLKKVKRALLPLGLRMRTVGPEEYFQPVGYLAGVKEVPPAENDRPGTEFDCERVFQGKQEQENDSHDEVFRALIARNCSEHYKCACCIAEYVRNTWHKELSDEELVFLTIHLKRIRMGK